MVIAREWRDLPRDLLQGGSAGREGWFFGGTPGAEWGNTIAPFKPTHGCGLKLHGPIIWRSPHPPSPRLPSDHLWLKPLRSNPDLQENR